MQERIDEELVGVAASACRVLVRPKPNAPPSSNRRRRVNEAAGSITSRSRVSLAIPSVVTACHIGCNNAISDKCQWDSSKTVLTILEHAALPTHATRHALAALLLL